MTPAQIALVQDSFRQVLPIRELAATMFYTRLFKLAPDTRPMFRGDLKGQGAKLMAALARVVHGLDRLETIVADVQALARRHVGYGVRRHHYAAVGEALLGTLAQAFGPDFTPALKEAWIAAYKLLSDAMIAAAEDELAAA